MADQQISEPHGEAVKLVRTKRLLLAGASAFLSINLWTGAPLLSLWVGSQFVGDENRLSMTAVEIVVVTLAVLVFVMAFALIRLNATYRRLTGHPLRENRLTWLRPMNAEEETVGERVPITLLERIVMWNVYVAVIALVVLYFAVPQSPLPHP